MKKIIAMIMCAVLLFIGCASKNTLAAEEVELNKTHIGGAVLKVAARDAAKDVYTDSEIVKTDEYKPFTKKMVVYGITFVAKDDISDEFMLKVARTMKEMFPRSEGIDLKLQEKVLQNLYKYNALIPVVKDESDLEPPDEEGNTFSKLVKENSICDIIMEGSEHQALEVVEHILHTVTDIGLHYTLTERWGLTKDSIVYKSMKEAINKKYYNIDGYNDIPEGETKNRILIQEYAYWLITSAWNIQETYGLGEDEWKLKNKEMLKESLPSGYDLYEEAIPQIMAVPSKETLDSLESGNNNDLDGDLLSNVRQELKGYKIVYASPNDNRDGSDTEIYMMDADGSHVEALTSNGGNNLYPSWGPNAKYVYYAGTAHGGTYEIYRVNVETLEEKRISDFGIDVRSVAVSHDNKYLAVSLMSANSFESEKEGLEDYSSDLYIIKMDTVEKYITNNNFLEKKDLETLVSTPQSEHFWYEELNWNPNPRDGEARLVYSRTYKYDKDDESYTDIWTIKTNGSENKKIISNQDMPLWSFDGKKLSFLNLNTYDLESKVLEEIYVTGEERETSGVHLSPKGDYIIFEIGDHNRRTGIAKLQLKENEKNPITILSDRLTMEPRWSPKPVNEGKAINENYQKYIGPEDIIRDITKLGGIYKKYYTKYIQYIAPNGNPITIVAQDKVRDEQILKAYNQLSFYLEDYGKYKKDKIANKMADNGAVLVMPNGADGESDIPERALEGQPLYQMETPTVGSKWYIENDYEHRDAAYEEILHMVHDYGIGTIGNEGALPDLQQQIYKATINSLPKDKADWGKKGLWGLDSKEWLLELEEEGSLEQEYLASVVDSYYGLWAPFTENDGGMWGVYTSKTREDIKKNDPMGYKIVREFLPSYITYMARIDSEFSGTFKMYYDKKEPYTHKSKYLKNARLLGNKDTELIGNMEDNILIGNSGNNKIDGQEGNDTVQFTGDSSDYKIIKKNGNIIIEDRLVRDGTDTLIGIEILRFTDKDILTSEIK